MASACAGNENTFGEEEIVLGGRNHTAILREDIQRL